MASHRISVVTGGASGIGLAVCRRFARAGDTIVIGGIDDAQNETALRSLKAEGHERVHAIQLDVADEASTDRFAAKVESEIGPIGVLVTSAGILQNASVSAKMPLDQHDRLWAVNYRGTYLSCRAMAPLMAARGKGAIVTLGSINSVRVLPLPAYNPSKAAVMALTELLAVEYGRKGVRVNCVAPGFTLTDNLKARIEAGLRDAERMKMPTALNRIVEPSEIAEGIHFLCSDAASAITGILMPIDAGWLPAVSYRSYPAEVEE